MTMRRGKALGRIAKAAWRIAAGIVLIAVLFLLVSAEPRIPSRLAQPAAAQPMPTASSLSAGMVLYRTDVSTVLMCLLTEPEGILAETGEATYPSMMFLVSIGGMGDVDVINLPPGTRALVRYNCGDGQQAYRDDALATAYAAGLEDGTQKERLLESTEKLLGGISIQRAVFLEREGFIKFVDELGGVFVKKDDFSIACGGIAREDAPVGRPVLLSGQRSLAYMSSIYAGTDIGALQRQNHLLSALIEQMLGAGITFEEIARQCEGALEHDLTPVDMLRMKRAFGGLSAGELEKEAVHTLWGEPRMMNGQGWLPDRLKIKEYVLGRFYQNARSASAMDQLP